MGMTPMRLGDGGMPSRSSSSNDCSMAISGTDLLEVPSIYKAYVRAM